MNYIKGKKKAWADIQVKVETKRDISHFIPSVLLLSVFSFSSLVPFENLASLSLFCKACKLEAVSFQS